MDINLFDFNLPEELIAQSPANKREESRLLVIDKENKSYSDHTFFEIINYLRPGDVLVRNNTKVLPVRLFATKVGTGAKVEVLLLKEIAKDTYECLTGNAKVLKLGTVISFKNDLLRGEVINVLDEGIRHIKFSYTGIFYEILEEIGNMPLPPYIKKQCVDNSRYQTVYAKVVGSSAAPTAGFHFSDKLLEDIKNKGIEIVDVTLQIGLGTFRPVKVDDTDNHVMHSEHYIVSKEAGDKLNKAKKENRRIIAVGTTSVRTLEANINKFGEFHEEESDTNIFIFPGYKFKAIDCLITNFHLPKSTLVMLVSAFAGREFTLECYKHAVDNKYRFFSFGDSMFIHGK